MSSEPRIGQSGLNPYASFLVMECEATDPAAAVRGQLLTFIRERLGASRSGSVTILAAGISGITGEDAGRGGGDLGALDQAEGLLYRREAPPPWTGSDSPYVDVEHELLVIFRRGALVAVHGEQRLRDSIWNWLHREPFPSFRPVPQAILQGAFVRGATRGLWLIGTHPRRATKADAKNMTGPNLGEALNPFDDGTFALGSAKSRLPEDDHLPALGRDAGTTPRRGTVWLRPTETFQDFRAAAQDMLQLIDETTAASGGVERPFPLLTSEVGDLTNVARAYEIAVPGRDDLLGDPNVSPDALDAATLLERAILNVQAVPNGPNFTVEVGLNGVISGQLTCSVSLARRRVHLSFGFGVIRGNGQVVRSIFNALEENRELLSVYYLSGHCIRGGGVFRPEIRAAPFPRWDFRDFQPFSILEEKPATTPNDIHRLVGTAGELSLLSWVVKEHPAGWLTCDDGAGEVADFVHIDVPSSKLTLLHVKAATTDSAGRGISASAYEVVVGQASKNLGFLNSESLYARLASPGRALRATWKDGIRQPDRSGFLAALAGCPAAAQMEVVVLQPHVREARYRQLQQQNPPNEDSLRLARLETLLNSARGGITGVGGDLRVIAST